MPMCVSDERDEQDVGRHALELPDALESLPGVAGGGLVRTPGGLTGPLLWSIASLVERRAARHGGVPLAGQQVHAGPGKVVEPARVIEVEVCEDDVADIPRIEAAALNLTNGRH